MLSSYCLRSRRLARRALMMRILSPRSVCTTTSNLSRCERPKMMKPVLGLRVRRIENRHGKRIAKHRRGFFKMNSVLGQIRRGLTGIPFKSEHAGDSNAICPNRPSQNEFRKRVPVRPAMRDATSCPCGMRIAECGIRIWSARTRPRFGSTSRPGGIASRKAMSCHRTPHWKRGRDRPGCPVRRRAGRSNPICN